MTLASCSQSPADDFHGVDDADDGRVDRAVLQAGRHAGGAAADDEDGLADTGVDGVDGDQVGAFSFSVRIHRPRDQQLAADQPRVLAGGDDGPDDAGENHWGRTGRDPGSRPWRQRSPCRSAARPRGSRADAG